MKLRTETTSGTLHRDTDGRWYVFTRLIGKVYLDTRLQQRPNPNTEGVDVAVEVTGAGPSSSGWAVTDYHFL